MSEKRKFLRTVLAMLCIGVGGFAVANVSCGAVEGTACAAEECAAAMHTHSTADIDLAGDLTVGGQVTGTSFGVGTTMPMASLHIVRADASDYLRFVRSDSTGDWSIGFGGNDFLLTDRAAGETRFTVLNGSGRVGIGTTSPSAQLEVVGDIVASGSITPGSSRALKENIRSISTADALATLKGLRPKRFYYKANKVDEHLGFIAEDVPELVATKDRRGVSPTDIAAVLTKVVQLQQEEIEALQRQLETQRRRIGQLEKKRK